MTKTMASPRVCVWQFAKSWSCARPTGFRAGRRTLPRSWTMSVRRCVRRNGLAQLTMAGQGWMRNGRTGASHCPELAAIYRVLTGASCPCLPFRP